MKRHRVWWATGALAVSLLDSEAVWGSGSAGGSAAAASRCGPVAQRPWCNTALSSLARATRLEGAMSTSDKAPLLTGGAIPDVGIPAIKFTDGALGVRGTGTQSATAMPAGIALAANFDPFDAYLYGTVVGRDAKALGYDGIFGPTVNIMRTPLGGRTYEGYGEDPYLASATAVGWIDGEQSQGVMADVKHFVANDQEGYLGVPLLTGAIGGRLYVNSVVDPRTLHEIDLMPFQAAVQQADTATVMCGYNQLNGAFDCENSQLLQQTLEQDWGFNGFVMSDAGAAHNTKADLNNGTDFDILGSAYNAAEVEANLAAGQVSMATLNAAVLRILTRPCSPSASSTTRPTGPARSFAQPGGRRRRGRSGPRSSRASPCCRTPTTCCRSTRPSCRRWQSSARRPTPTSGAAGPRRSHPPRW